nr:hypothetical protein [Tanacetum cinerariifolium]
FIGKSIVTKENRAACILDNHAEAAKRIEVKNSRVNVVTRPVSAPPATEAVAPAKPLSFIENLYLQI